MASTTQFAEVAAVASDPARAAGIAPQTASGHLARMVAVGVVTIEKKRRHRYVSLASPAVAQMTEGIMQVAYGIGSGCGRRLSSGRAMPRSEPHAPAMVTSPRGPRRRDGDKRLHIADQERWRDHNGTHNSDASRKSTWKSSI